MTAGEMGLNPGIAMDLRAGWDFRLSRHREAAMKYVEEVRPRLVIGSPECRMFSTLQTLSVWTDKKSEEYADAVKHLEFVMKVYEKQVREDRFFLHEHPASATSWNLQSVKRVMGMPGVKVVNCDQCYFGQKAKESTRGPWNQRESEPNSWETLST